MPCVRFTVRGILLATAFVALLLGLLSWGVRNQRRVDSEFYAELEQSFLQLAIKAERSAGANPTDSARASQQAKAFRKEAAKLGQMSRRAKQAASHRWGIVERKP